MAGLTPTHPSVRASTKFLVAIDQWENEGGSPAAAVADASAASTTSPIGSTRAAVFALEPLGDVFDIRARQSLQLVAPPGMRRRYGFACERGTLGGIRFEIVSPRVASPMLLA